MRKAYANTSEGQIRYIEMGQGETLLLLHETPRTAEVFSGVISDLAEHFRVIAMDTPGYGCSDRPSTDPGIEGYARSLAEFLDVLGVERTSLFGRRTGASIAVEFAATWPDRVIKLILDGCPDFEPEVRQRRINSRIPMLAIESDGSHLEKAWDAANRDRQGWVPIELIHRCAVDNLVAAGYPNYGHMAVFQQDIQAKFPKIMAPTLLFSGDGDDFLDRQPHILPLLRDGHTRVIPNCHRFPVEEKPAETCQVITEFILSK